MAADDIAGLVNPTRRLPPVKSEPTAIQFFCALCHLAHLYSSTSLTSQEAKLFLQYQPPISDHDESVAFQDAMDSAQVDEYEKRFAMSWITRLISTELFWVQEEQDLSSFSTESLLDLAGRVLGGQAAIGEAGALVREFDFPLKQPMFKDVSTSDSNMVSPSFVKIHVELCDAPLPPSQSQNPSSSSPPSNHSVVATAAAVGVQTWGSAVIMSDLFVRNPSLFHKDICTSSIPSDKPFKIAELGAGTGLVGMVAAKTLAAFNIPAHVTMSDYHDQVLDNLRNNVAHNFSLNQSSHGVSVSVEKLDWQQVHDQRFPPNPDKVAIDNKVKMEKYDLLFLADVIYDHQHALWLHSCISEMLSTESPFHSRAHLLIPLRNSGKFEGIHKTVEQVFGSTSSFASLPPSLHSSALPLPPSLLSSISATPTDTQPGTPTTLSSSCTLPLFKSSDLLYHRIESLDQQPFIHRKLSILQVRTLEKRGGIGRQDEQGYLWFEIGWI